MSGRGSKTGREALDYSLARRDGLHMALRLLAPARTNQPLPRRGIRAGGQSAVREVRGPKQHQYSGGSAAYTNGVVSWRCGEIYCKLCQFLRSLPLHFFPFLGFLSGFPFLCGSLRLIVGLFEGPSLTCYEWAWFKNGPRSPGLLFGTSRWA
ncbi:uncharacterized protein Tco025E_08417, partial [Trypanosoma conorhini]